MARPLLPYARIAELPPVSTKKPEEAKLFRRGDEQMLVSNSLFLGRLSATALQDRIDVRVEVFSRFEEPERHLQGI